MASELFDWYLPRSLTKLPNCEKFISTYYVRTFEFLQGMADLGLLGCVDLCESKKTLDDKFLLQRVDGHFNILLNKTFYKCFIDIVDISRQIEQLS